MDYRIGLDIGIASVGWAVLENDYKDEPKGILDLGVRIFDAAEAPKTGDSLAAPRRGARTTRRRLRRRRHRLDRIKYLLQCSGLVQLDQFMDKYQTGELDNVYELRNEALERLLSGEELAQILIHIAKHRGFKSTRKAESKDDEGGKVLKATSENSTLMLEKGYRTVGEMIYKDDKFRMDAPWNMEHYLLAPRNKKDNYKHTILRSMLVDEVKYIFKEQRGFKSELATEELENQFLDIMCSQRSFDKGPGMQADGTPSPYGGDLIEKMVGYCTLEPKERRAAKACYSSEEFVMLQKVNGLRLICANGEICTLTEEQRDTLINLAYTQKKLTYGSIRKKISIPESQKFVGVTYSSDKAKNEDIEKKTSFVKMEWFFSIREALQKEYDNTTLLPEQIDKLDEIGNLLTLYKSDESRIDHLKNLQLSDTQIEALLLLNPSKFHNLSIKAMKSIMPYLRQGFVYSKACENAGYDFKAESSDERGFQLKGETITSIINEIPNPVVKRSVSQTVKVINAIIQKYGSPQAVNIELAREMSRNFKDRRDMNKSMQDNQAKNERIKKELEETYGVKHPTGQDILKYKLWKDQDGICLYSGDKIPAERLFEKGECDIDHVIPYSISFDDSYRNKVLVKASENRQKGNRTPYEYFGDNLHQWNKYESLVKMYVKDYRKQQILLKRNFTESDRQAFKERNLQDTKYTTVVVHDLIKNYLKFAPYSDPTKKKKVFAVNGSITAYLRKRWGLMYDADGNYTEKDRSTDKHHAKDAVVIACCTDGMINKISRNVMGRELAYSFDLECVDIETGEILKRKDFASHDEWDDKFGVKIPLPWPHFRDELEIRMSDDPNTYVTKSGMTCDKLYYENYYYDNEDKIKPIFVSRMPNHKVTGQGHAETIRSARHFEDEGIVLSKVPLSSLKLSKEGEIENYYNPSSDILLYEAIKDQLRKFGNDGAKAFATDFHKPKSDGTLGPVVKTVKTIKKQSLGVYVNGGKGIAENGSMVRIDVFRENGKYYFVPIYTSDTVKKVLPNKASTAYKPYCEWKEVNEEDFIFSLYSRDLIAFSHKKGMRATTSNQKVICVKDTFAYYIGANIATASISGIAHDKSFEFESMGIQSLVYLSKFQVDVLGNFHEVKHEIRMRF